MAKHIQYSDHISVDPDVLGGRPVVKGVRIPVDIVLDRLAHDLDTTSLFADYPRLTEDDIKACLAYAQHLLLLEKPPMKAASRGAKKQAIDETLALAGSWGEVDWNHALEELDRIRHQSKPTPPITFDL